MNVPRVEVDVNVCPVCGARESFREQASRLTAQPLTLALDEDGELVAEDYSEFEWFDETADETYDCRQCETSWPTLTALHDEMLTVAFLEWVASEVAELASEITVPFGAEPEVGVPMSRLVDIERAINGALSPPRAMSAAERRSE